jgi:hypothetical protein
MADTKETKEEIIPVGPGVEEDAPEGADAGRETRAGDDYEYPEGEDGVEERAAGEERAGHSDEEPEGEGEESLSREQKRRRRKREKYERDQRELALLRTRNEQLEREHSRRLAAMETRQTQSDVLAIDGRISQAEADVREAETLLTQALENKDSASAVEALRVRDQLRDGLNQLKFAKQSTVRTAQERQTAATQPQALDPNIMSRAQQWQRDHAWFDPTQRDEDSVIASAVEQRLFNEGRLNPASDEYWEEVDRRLARRLPERYRNRGEVDDDDDDDLPGERRPARRVNGNGKDNGQRRPTGPTIKVGGRERTLRKGEVFIDEDRKQAMIEAGVWDDPKERERFMKSYQKYDRDAGRRPR